MNKPALVIACPETMESHVAKVMSGEYAIEGLEFKNAPIIIDIGANVGAFSAWAFKRWPEAKIYAYEPHPDNFGLLKANLKNCALLYNVAVSDHRGSEILYDGKNNCGEASLYNLHDQAEPKSRVVEVISAETLPVCDILKIDTEGSEWPILSTYPHLETLSAVMLEWHSKEDRGRIAGLLNNKGFTCYQDQSWSPTRGVMKWTGSSEHTVKIGRVCGTNALVGSAVNGNTQPGASRARRRMSLRTRLKDRLLVRNNDIAIKVLAHLPNRSSQRVRRGAVPFCLMIQVGRKQVPFLRQGLWSLSVCWDPLPTLRIINDGRADEREVRAAAECWPGAIDFCSSSSVIRAAEEHSEALGRFAQSSAFGLKFAAVVLSGAEQPTLFSDPDVLWFRDFASEVSNIPLTRGVRFAVSQECQPGYDVDILSKLHIDLSERPFVNTGVIFLDGDLLSAVDLEACLIAAAESNSRLTEQTLFAIAARQLGASVFGRESIACFDRDSRSFGFTFRGHSWHARHYYGPVRSLFWRDALPLRLGVRP
jgi:FkbM family methyltransferase